MNANAHCDTDVVAVGGKGRKDSATQAQQLSSELDAKGSAPTIVAVNPVIVEADGGAP